MKKTMSLILSATMLVACVSCQAKSGGLNDKESQPESTVTVLEDESTVTTFEEESTTAPSQEELLPPVLFSSYDDILNTISCIAKQGGREAFEAGMPTLDSREQKIYQTLCDITSKMINLPTKHEMLCYYLDIDGNGTEEIFISVFQANGKPLEEAQTAFTLRGGVPVQDDGTLLARYLQMKPEERPIASKLQKPLVTHAHYRIMEIDFQNVRTDKILYEIYASDGTLVKTSNAEHSFWGYQEGNLIRFTAYHEVHNYTTFFYSISQNKFSDNFLGTIVEFSTDKIVYIKDGILTAQDIFDRNAYYEEFPQYRGVSSVYFAEDGKSLSFRHVVEGAKKDATSVICFEELPIIRAIKICYVRTGPGTNYDVLMLSSGNPAYLRSATQDTARLLQAEPVIGGSYESDDGTVRNDWYKISYYGRECYVSADSFEVEIYRITDDEE